MNVVDLYFNWMVDLVGGQRYTKLIRQLFETPFYFILRMDQNRIEDGVELRYTWGHEHGIADPIIASELDIHPCSVLEMMLALAIRCEENIMTDLDVGNRTAEWFWDMIKNLGLMEMDNMHYDDIFVENALVNFMERGYNPDGSGGGLFVLQNPRDDLRNVEIWYQAMWFFSENYC